MVFGGNVEAHAAQREVAVGNHLVGNVFERVFFVFRAEPAERIVHGHVGVERVIFWHTLVLGIAIIEWGVELCLFGQQLAELHVRGYAIFHEVVATAARDGFFQSAETLGFDVSRKVECGKV